MTSTPITGAPDWASSQASPWTTMNSAHRYLEAGFASAIIEDRDLSSPPGSCADGARYLIASTGGGLWAGQTGKLAVAVGVSAASGWYFLTVAVEGFRLYIKDENVIIQYDGAAWATAPGSVSNLNDLTDVNVSSPNDGDILYYDVTNNAWYNAPASSAINPTESFIIAIGDETTAITTGTAKTTFRMPYAFRLTAVRASLTAGSSSGAPQFDINEGGVSILSTKLTIEQGEKTSTTAATAAVISDANLADDAEITIDIDTAGTGATGAKITLIGYRP